MMMMAFYKELAIVSVCAFLLLLVYFGLSFKIKSLQDKSLMATTVLLITMEFLHYYTFLPIICGSLIAGIIGQIYKNHLINKAKIKTNQPKSIPYAIIVHVVLLILFTRELIVFESIIIKIYGSRLTTFQNLLSGGQIFLLYSLCIYILGMAIATGSADKHLIIIFIILAIEDIAGYVAEFIAHLMLMPYLPQKPLTITTLIFIIAIFIISIYATQKKLKDFSKTYMKNITDLQPLKADISTLPHPTLPFNLVTTMIILGTCLTFLAEGILLAIQGL